MEGAFIQGSCPDYGGCYLQLKGEYWYHDDILSYKQSDNILL